MGRSERPADYPGCPVTVDDALAAGRALAPVRWGLRDAVICLAGTLALGLALAVVLAVAGRPPAGVALVLGATVPWLALAGWPLWATARFGNGPVIDLGLRFRPNDIGWGAVGGLAALGLGLLATRITQWWAGDFDSAAGKAAADAAATSPRWLMVLIAAIVALGAPVAEELAFRGLLWAGLARLGMRPYLTLVTTTLVFALFHFESSRVAVLLAIGLVLGFLRLFTRRLGASILAHSVNNLPGAIGIALT